MPNRCGRGWRVQPPASSANGRERSSDSAIPTTGRERAAYRHTQEVTVYVASDSTGLGIGRRLVERLVAECRTTECHALVACITADNEPSRRLFESIGFRRVSHFEQVGRKFGRWLDVVDYELLL